MDTDLRNTKARLVKLAIAAAIGLVFTWFTMHAMTSSGPSAPAASRDPVGASEVPLLAIFIFVLTTAFSHVILSKRRS